MKGPLRDFGTGTGFARAKLSEILPAARVARFVRMTWGAVACALRQDDLGVRSRARFRLTQKIRTSIFLMVGLN
jgi:hypothetical protein